MSQGTPRKFSEKIAILERKQNEEQEMFHNVMRDVRAITSNKTPSSTAASPTTTYPCSPTSGSSGFSDAPQIPLQQQQSCGSPSTLSANVHPLAFAWNRSGGSLPNVHQMVEQQPYADYPGWNRGTAVQGHQVRTRSPGAHYHPYRVGYPTLTGQKTNERVPPLENHMVTPTIHLQPPDPNWSRARSDPTINVNAMAATSANVNYSYNPHQQQQPSVSSAPQNMANQFNSALDYRNLMMNDSSYSTMSAQQYAANFSQYSGGQQFPMYNASAPSQPQFTFAMQQQLLQQQQQQQQLQQQMQQQMQQQSQASNHVAAIKQQQQRSLPQQASSSSSANNTPVGSLPNMNSSIVQGQFYNDGRALAMNQMSPTAGSTATSDNRSGPMSVPTTAMSGGNNGFMNYSQDQQQQHRPVSGLHLLQQQQQHHQQQLQQNQQAFCCQQQQLSAVSGDINSSQSAPTSPAQDSIEAPIRQHWPPTRHYSASPDTLDIPNIVLTGADGTLDCFQDLQDLHLDNEIQQLLNDPNSNEQMDPALETQLLN